MPINVPVFQGGPILNFQGVRPTTSDWGPKDVSKMMQEGLGNLYGNYNAAYKDSYSHAAREDAARRLAADPGTQARELSAPGGPYAPAGSNAAPSSAPSTPRPPSFTSLPNQGVSAQLQPLFDQHEQQYALPPGTLGSLAFIESKFNPNAKNKNSSAGGLFQQIDSNWATYGDPSSNRYDPNASTAAAAKFAADNARQLQGALGRMPTVGELYLAHQQGPGGALKLLSNPDALAKDVVGAKAVRLNGGDMNMTAGQFANQWTSKADQVWQNLYGGKQQAAAAPGGQAPLQVDPRTANMTQAEIEAQDRQRGVQAPAMPGAQPQASPQGAPMPAPGGPAMTMPGEPAAAPGPQAALQGGAGGPLQGGAGQDVIMEAQLKETLRIANDPTVDNATRGAAAKTYNRLVAEQQQRQQGAPAPAPRQWVDPPPDPAQQAPPGAPQAAPAPPPVQAPPPGPQAAPAPPPGPQAAPAPPPTLTGNNQSLFGDPAAISPSAIPGGFGPAGSQPPGAGVQMPPGTEAPGGPGAPAPGQPPQGTPPQPQQTPLPPGAGGGGPGAQQHGGNVPPGALGMGAGMSENQRAMLASAIRSGDASTITAVQNYLTGQGVGAGSKGYGFQEVGGQLYRTNPVTGEAQAIAGSTNRAQDWSVEKDGSGGLIRVNKVTGESQPVGSSTGIRPNGDLILPPNDPRRAEMGIPSDNRTWRVRQSDRGPEKTPLDEREEKSFERENQLATQFESNPTVKNFRALSEANVAMRAAFGQGTAAGDINGVIQVLKAIDPTSTVTQNEQGMITSSGGIPGWAQGMVSRLNGGAPLTSQMKADFVNAAEAQRQARWGQTKGFVNGIRNRARSAGLSEDGQKGATNFFEDPQFGGPAKPDEFKDSSQGPSSQKQGSIKNPVAVPTMEAGDAMPAGSVFVTPDGNVYESEGKGGK